MSRGSPVPAPRGAPAPPQGAPIVVWKNIGVLRGIAMCLVVVHHATHWAFTTRRLVLATDPLAAWEGLIEVCGRALPPVSVPAFLFASGYFVARFSSSWTAAKASAWKVAVRYVGWWAAGMVFLAMARRHLDLHDLLPHFLFGGPFIAYWFFPLIVELVLVAPLLVTAARSRPRATIAAAVVIEVLSVAAYYLLLRRGLPPGSFLWSQWNHVFVLKLPYFVYGIVFSQHADAAVAWLAPRRTAIGWGVALMGVATCAEPVLIGSLGGGAGPASWGDAVRISESAPMHVLALLFVAWMVSRPSRPTRRSEWLNAVGLRSLGILLLHDAVLLVVFNALWQARRLFGIVTPPGIPPAYMVEPWWLPIAVLAGIGLPLAVMRWTERLFGKRAAALLFG